MTTSSASDKETPGRDAFEYRNRVYRPSQLLQRVEDWLFGYDFFISYRWSDGRTYAESLAKALGETHSCFLDSAEYAGGDDVVSVGNRALQNTERLILVATNGVAQSEHVKRELMVYRELRRQVIGIDFGGSIANLRNSDPAFGLLLTDNELYLSEGSDRNPDDGPSPHIVNEISRSVSIGMKRFRRRRAIIATFAALTMLLLLLTLAAATVKQMLDYESARQQLLVAFSAQIRGLEERQLHVTIDYETRLQKSRVVDIENLVAACNTVGDVRSLHLLNCDLVNIHALSSCTSLRHLNLFKSRGVHELSFLSKMPNIHVIQLHGTQLNDAVIAKTEFPGSVEELKLSNNPQLTAASISPLLSNLKNMKSLSLSGCTGVAISQRNVDQLLKHAEYLQSQESAFFVDLKGTDLSQIDLADFRRQAQLKGLDVNGVTTVESVVN